MKYIKKFENINDLFKKGEIVLRPGQYSSALYLLLQNVNNDDDWISIFYIGTIYFNYNNVKIARLIFNTKDIGIVKVRNNSKDFCSFRKITDEEKILIFEDMRVDKYDVSHYLDLIFNKTGIDLKEYTEYKDYLLKIDTEKYNL